MERRAVPPLAEVDAGRQPAPSLRWLRRQLEPLTRVAFSVEGACRLACWTVSTAAALVFAAFAVGRHRAYESTAYDFGFFDQVVWNTSRGDWFETSFVGYNFLGQHFEPILLVFAGLYSLGEDVHPLPSLKLVLRFIGALRALKNQWDIRSVVLPAHLDLLADISRFEGSRGA